MMMMMMMIFSSHKLWYMLLSTVYFYFAHAEYWVLLVDGILNYSVSPYERRISIVSTV